MPSTWVKEKGILKLKIKALIRLKTAYKSFYQMIPTTPQSNSYYAIVWVRKPKTQRSEVQGPIATKCYRLDSNQVYLAAESLPALSLPLHPFLPPLRCSMECWTAAQYVMRAASNLSFLTAGPKAFHIHDFKYLPSDRMTHRSPKRSSHQQNYKPDK